MTRFYPCLVFLFVLIIFCQGHALAQESSDFTVYGPKTSEIMDVSDGALNHDSYHCDRPVWMSLKDMTPAERANAELTIQLENTATAEANGEARAIERLWNAGECEQALEKFPPLADLTRAEAISIGICWREPLAGAGEKWGGDVRIGDRDSIYVTAFDIDHETGNLFAVTMFLGNGHTANWTMNFSDDGGITWVETYLWWANYDLPMVDVAVRRDYCFVGYIRGLDQESIQVQRFDVNTGMRVVFSDGYYSANVVSVTPPESFEEIAMTSNEDYFTISDRIYIFAITSDGELRFFWDDAEAQSWTEDSPGISDAENGLDVCYNAEFHDYWMFFSYINNAHEVRIFGYTLAGVWTDLWTYNVNSSGADYTSIGACKDTVHCAFEYYGTTKYIRYLVSYNGGNSFLWGSVDDTTVLAECPSVACRNGGGAAITYRYYTTPREGRLIWRDYAGVWSTPKTFTDFAPYYNRASVEYLGNDKFGVVYTTWSDPVYHAAFFDNGSGCCATPGDANGDGVCNVGDAVYIINYVFKGGAAPPCMAEADANGDGIANVGDAVYIINYIFKGGSAPVCL